MIIDILLVIFLIIYFSYVAYKVYLSFKNGHTCSCSKVKNIQKMVKNIKKEIDISCGK